MICAPAFTASIENSASSYLVHKNASSLYGNVITPSGAKGSFKVMTPLF